MTETWTPMVVVIPDRIASVLKEVVSETFRAASDEDRLNIENFCALVGWSSDDLATGAWLAMVIDKHLSVP